MKILKTFIILGCLFTVLSCSQDSIEPQENSIELAESSEISTPNRALTKILLVEYKAGLSETRKKEIRDYYKGIDFLISWEECNDKDFDTWTVSCGRKGEWCGKESDTPIDTDDDVKKIKFDHDCSDL